MYSFYWISPDSASLYETYSKLYEEDPFSEDTMNAGETLMAAISEDRRNSWQDLIESVDMTHNSKRAWSTIKEINNDPQKGHTALQCHSRPGCSPAAAEWETTTQDTPQKGNKTTTWGHGVNMAVYRWGTPGGNWLPEERQSRWPGWYPHRTNQTPWTDCS